MEGREVPRALERDEIKALVQSYVKASLYAINKAGFDGVEIHGAHGYLVDQFLQDTANRRTDIWGGNIENRARFALEVIRKIVDVVGEERTAIRLSPFNTNQGMPFFLEIE